MKETLLWPQSNVSGSVRVRSVGIGQWFHPEGESYPKELLVSSLGFLSWSLGASGSTATKSDAGPPVENCHGEELKPLLY